MAVSIDFSDVDAFFDEGMDEVKDGMVEAGEMGVEYAKEHGDYQDQTGILRKSNEFKVDKSGLTLKNEAEYASFVEANGFEVLSGGALEALNYLKEKFE